MSLNYKAIETVLSCNFPGLVRRDWLETSLPWHNTRVWTRIQILKLLPTPINNLERERKENWRVFFKGVVKVRGVGKMAWSECMQIVLNPSETNFETESDQWRWIGIQMYNWKWVGRWNKVDEMCIFREKERKKERKRLQRKTLLLLLLLLLVLGTSAISWWRQLIGALRGVFQAAAPSTGTVGAECRAHTGVATHRSRTFARFPTFYPPLFPQSLSAGLFLFSLPRMGWQCHVAAGNRGFHHTLSIALASGFFFFFFFFFFSHFFLGEHFSNVRFSPGEFVLLMSEFAGRVETSRTSPAIFLTH